MYEKIVQWKPEFSDGKKYNRDAKKSMEEKTGQPVITSKNAIDFGKLIGDVAKELENKDDGK